MLNGGRWERGEVASRGSRLGKHASTTAADRGVHRKLWQMLIKKLQKIFIAIKVFTRLKNPDKNGMLHVFSAVTAYSEYDLILMKARVNCFLVG